MNFDLELMNILYEHQCATTEMLWQKLHSLRRCIGDISSLVTGKGTAGLVVEYIESLAETETDSRQFVSVGHRDLDLVLRRYMLEVTFFQTVVDFDLDDLPNLLAEGSVSVIRAIESGFAKLLNSPAIPHAFLHIKSEIDGVHIWIDAATGCVYDAKILV